MIENTVENFRENPPFSKGNPDFSFPNFECTELKNKKVYLIKDKTQPLINIKFLFKKGSYHENIFGLAHFTMQMLTLGTNKMTAEQIVDKIDFYGSQLSSASYWDESVISISLLNEHLDICFDILSDCVFNPLFDNSEVERLKKRQISYIQQQNADPSYVAQVAFNENFYKQHQYGHARIGYENTINSITEIDIRNFYDTLINSDFSIIVSGNFENENILKLIDNCLPNSENKYPTIYQQDNISIQKNWLIVNKEDATQATFRIGKPGFSRTNPDFPAYITANTIFGGFFLSRLNENLREKKGLTYGISSYSDARRYFSTFMISTNINEENTKIALDEIFNELTIFNSNKVSDEELNRAIQYMLGSFARGMENHRQISSLIQTLESYNLNTDYYTSIYSRISKLTVDDIFQVQQKFFNTDNMFVLVSGNQSRLEKIVENLNF